jgi:hypothetical protein
MLDTITYEINKALKSDAENAEMQRIISLAVDLAANKNVKQETITSEIHKALEKKAENLPKVRVLYSDSYGGFRYDASFQEHLRSIKGKTVVPDFGSKEIEVAKSKDLFEATGDSRVDDTLSETCVQKNIQILHL